MDPSSTCLKQNLANKVPTFCDKKKLIEIIPIKAIQSKAIKMVLK